MKKYIKTILITCTLAVTFFACEQDEIDTFSGENSIYFLWALDGVNDYNGNRLDSTSYSFAYSLPIVTENTYEIPVKLQGFVSNQDRSFIVNVASGTNAQEGVHYSLPESFIIPADSIIGYIPLQLNRTADLKNAETNIILELMSNENFDANLVGDETSDNANEILSYTKFELTISDILTEPTNWSRFIVYYLGDFSVKKLYLYAEVNNIPVPNWNDTMPEISQFFTHKNVLKAYLQAQAVAGTPVLEDDGTEMKLGRYAKSNKIIK